MQCKAWMTNDLFKAWMLHFLLKLSSLYAISATQRHLLILDGHKSHISLDVINIAMARGLDLVTLPSYTLHELQSLDVSYFKPFKATFHAY